MIILCIEAHQQSKISLSCDLPYPANPPNPVKILQESLGKGIGLDEPDKIDGKNYLFVIKMAATNPTGLDGARP